VSPEQTDVEDQVAETLIKRHSELWRKWGAMSLYHRKDWVWDITKHDQFFTGWISTPKMVSLSASRAFVREPSFKP